MERSRVAILELTRGWEAERVQRLVRETLQEVPDPLIYAEALDLFEEHRQRGWTSTWSPRQALRSCALWPSTSAWFRPCPGHPASPWMPLGDADRADQ
ncbi:MAG: hypothetical protein GEU81_14195 [Nitriliruptorales bacterium]|nr:hypothetical protein [Nitriliruptorales bacterium]